MEKSTQISPIILYQKKVLNLFVINFDQFCFFNSFKNYYLQVFLGECKSVTKENKMPDYITHDVEISSDDSDRKYSDEAISNEQNPEISNEENSNEKN